MAEVKLKADIRASTGKGAARAARRDGKVPAVLYGRGMEPVSLQVDKRELINAFHTDAGMNVLFDIEVNGDRTLAIARELQRDPVRGTLVHADFVKVDRSQRIEVEVPIHLVGDSVGVKLGGVLEHPLFTLHVRCPVTDVPEGIDVDISALAIGDSLRVSDVTVPAGVEVLSDTDAVVASIAAPISEAELEALEAEAGIEHEEPEAEAAEEAEGEAPEEGEPEGEAEETPEPSE